MAKALLLLFLTICQANFLFGDTIDPQEEKQYMYRLPTDVVPSSYALSLEPNLDNFTFTGSVDIAIEVKVEVNNITLNQKNLNIKSVNLKNLDGKTNDVKVKIDDLAEEEELLIIKPENDVIKKGNYILTINYSAELNDQKRGFYRSRYIDKNNNIK